MSHDYPNDKFESDVYAVQPARSRAWLWWLLGIFGGGIVLFCGGGIGLFFWLASAKPMEIYNVTAQRQGPTIVIRLAYDIKKHSHTIPFTRVIVEGPGWKHQQTAFGMGMVPFTGQITVTVPSDGGQPRRGGSATVYLESESQRGGGMERSSNSVTVTVPGV